MGEALALRVPLLPEAAEPLGRQAEWPPQFDVLFLHPPLRLLPGSVVLVP